MRTRIMAATPTYTGQVCVPFLQSFVASWGHLMVNGVEMELTVANHFTIIQFARNFLVWKFLHDPTCTHLLWIDSDLGWSPDAILRMVNRKKDVIAGVYPVKQRNGWFPYMQAGPPTEEGIQLAERVPTGFMLCSRDVVEAVAQSVLWHDLEHQGQKYSVPNVFDFVHEGKDLWGEDFVFCKRARGLGFEVWVETDVHFQHIGMSGWEGNLKDKLTNQAEGALVMNEPRSAA
jgi:hypothetical protein